GRQGLGTAVYVFPARQPGSGLANHIGSITVACLGVNGSVADVSAVNAATLVSVFCNGRKRKDQRMITVGKDKISHTGNLDWYVRVLYDNTLCDTWACIEKMEEVLFEIEFVYSEQHHMKLWAKSPSGTKSTLANIEPFAKTDKARRVRNTFRSNHFWGEKSEGRWGVYIGCNFSAAYPFP
ncbi:hypothetical protein MAR_006402, partial [Mya arenaria]